MKRILFVDDEPGVLDGLRNSLRKERHRWDMVFAAGGEDALVALENGPFDAVISDMRMPGIDGSRLLGCVKEKCPRTIRIILSGHAEQESIFRALTVAHQVLAKPCDPAMLLNVVERASHLQATLHDDGLVDRIGGLEKLPSSPLIVWRISDAMKDPNVAIHEIVGLVEADPAIALKLLQLVNSGFFGPSGQISSIAHAVSYLGLDLVRTLLLPAHLFAVAHTAPPIHVLSYEDLASHSLLTARVAKRIAGRARMADDCFTAGLLHDIGKIVLAVSLPDKFAAFLAKATPTLATEREVFGCTHAEVGAYLLALWGLPNRLVEAVAHHHTPSLVTHPGFEVVSCVHVSDALVGECLPTTLGIAFAHDPIDPS